MILAASAASLHPSFASLLNCSSISSFLNLCSVPKKISNVPLYLLMYFLSALQADPLSKVHFSLFSSYFHFSPVFSFWLPLPLWNLLHPSALFLPELPAASFPSSPSFSAILPRCRIDTQPILLQQQKEKEPSSRLPQDLSRPGTSVFLLAFLFLVFFFPPCRKENYHLFTVLFSTNFFFCASPSSFSFSSFSSTSFPPPFYWLFQGSRVPSLAVCFKGSEVSAFSVLTKCPWVLKNGCFLVVYWDPFPGCFLEKFFGSFPWLFFLLSSRLLETCLHPAPREPFISHIIAFLCLFPRGDQELSRARAPILGVLEFPLPRLPPTSSEPSAGSTSEP